LNPTEKNWIKGAWLAEGGKMKSKGAISNGKKKKKEQFSGNDDPL